MNENFLKKNPLINTISAVSVLFVFSMILYFICHSFLEPKGCEFMTKITAKQPASENVVSIVIDDKAISEIGRWPWARNRYADIFDYLYTYSHARAIGFDSLITSKGDSKDDDFFFKRTKKIPIIYWGMSFLNNSEQSKVQSKLLEQKYPLNITDERLIKTKIPEYSTFSNFLPQMFDSAHKVGSVLSTPEKDGVTKNSELIFHYKGKYYPSISLAIFSDYYKIKKFKLYNDAIVAQSANKTFSIPVSTDGKVVMAIKWYKLKSKNGKQGLYAHTEYSASDVLKSYDAIKKGQKPILDPNIFKGKIVLLGATATALYDIKMTPLGVNYHGTDIQATNIDNLINQNYVNLFPKWINTVLILLMIGLTVLFVSSFEPIVSVLSTFFVALAYLLLAYIAYSNNYMFDYVTSLVFMLFVLGASYIYKFVLEGQNKEKIKNAMSKYISDDVMSEIIHNIDELQLGGKRTEVTVLFADIRGFTTISEMYEPEEVSKILNNYFSEMIPIVNKYNGVLNKFIGDALLAVFGDPIPSEDHAINAVLCADEMIKKVEELHKEWKTKGLPRLNIGVGINTGIVFAGNIGSSSRMEYTVIGDAVNVASRIEAYNKIYKTKFLISETTYQKSKNCIDVIKISEVPIRGRVETINIYEILKVNTNATL